MTFDPKMWYSYEGSQANTSSMNKEIDRANPPKTVSYTDLAGMSEADHAWCMENYVKEDSKHGGWRYVGQTFDIFADTDACVVGQLKEKK